MVAFLPRTSMRELSSIRYLACLREIYKPNAHLFAIVDHKDTTANYLLKDIIVSYIFTIKHI